METKRSYFVSDVHLGLDVKDAAGRERRFVDFLRSIPVQETEALYLLGDIWDFWYEYESVVPKGYVQVFAALQDLMAAGVKVRFFRGNHDLWAYSYFAEMGMEVLEQPFTAQVGGLTVCMGHGDGLGPGNLSYKLLNGLFRNRLVQRLFSLLHPTTAFRLGRSWSRGSRLAKSEAYHFRGPDEPLWKFAVERSQKEHVDLFVFGHYHCRVDTALPTGARLCVLQDWMDGDCYLYVSGTVTWGGSSRKMNR